MTRNEVEVGRIDPLGADVRERQQRNGGNIHAITSELEAQAADPENLSAGLRDAKAELRRADSIRGKAEAKLREQLQHQNSYSNLLESNQILRGEIGLAEAALAEYQSTSKNSATAFENWPFLMRQSGGRFGGWAREFALSISTARELIPLLEPWIKTARVRLADAERKAEQFRKEHGLNESSPKKSTA